jgi:hypothetical protein
MQLLLDLSCGMEIIFMNKTDNTPAPPQEKSDQAQGYEEEDRPDECGIHDCYDIDIGEPPE